MDLASIAETTNELRYEMAGTVVTVFIDNDDGTPPVKGIDGRKIPPSINRFVMAFSLNVQHIDFACKSSA